MKWKESEKNKYPNIILSDCVVDDIRINDGDIIMEFMKSGIIIKESSNSKYYRTHEAQIVLEKSDIENVSIKCVYKKKRIIGTTVDIVKDMERDTFFENISKGKWRFEIVEEFYSCVGGMYIGEVHKKNQSFWCCVKFYFKNIIYFWNEIDYRYDIN